MDFSKLTVITHTWTSQNRDISRSVESIQRALPKGASHKIIPCEGDIVEARWRALCENEVIAFVDDDDWISEDSLTKCMLALEASGAGLAFTDEVHVEADGSVCKRNDGKRDYGYMTITPMSVHHLCLIRTECVHPEAKILADQYGLAVEWLMKAYAGLKYGAIHVPIDGYYWFQNPNGHSRTPEWKVHFMKTVPLLRPHLQKWQRFKGTIPQYETEITNTMTKEIA